MNSSAMESSPPDTRGNSLRDALMALQSVVIWPTPKVQAGKEGAFISVVEWFIEKLWTQCPHEFDVKYINY